MSLKIIVKEFWDEFGTIIKLVIVVAILLTILNIIAPIRWGLYFYPLFSYQYKS